MNFWTSEASSNQLRDAKDQADSSQAQIASIELPLGLPAGQVEWSKGNSESSIYRTRFGIYRTSSGKSQQIRLNSKFLENWKFQNFKIMIFIYSLIRYITHYNVVTCYYILLQIKELSQLQQLMGARYCAMSTICIHFGSQHKQISPGLMNCVKTCRAIVGYHSLDCMQIFFTLLALRQHTGSPTFMEPNVESNTA